MSAYAYININVKTIEELDFDAIRLLVSGCRRTKIGNLYEKVHQKHPSCYEEATHGVRTTLQCQTRAKIAIW